MNINRLRQRLRGSSLEEQGISVAVAVKIRDAGASVFDAGAELPGETDLSGNVGDGYERERGRRRVISGEDLGIRREGNGEIENANTEKAKEDEGICHHGDELNVREW